MHKITIRYDKKSYSQCFYIPAGSICLYFMFMHIHRDLLCLNSSEPQKTMQADFKFSYNKSNLLLHFKPFYKLLLINYYYLLINNYYK